MTESGKLTALPAGVKCKRCKEWPKEKLMGKMVSFGAGLGLGRPLEGARSFSDERKPFLTEL